MSRKRYPSANWKKAKTHVQKPHTKIANIRRGYLNKTSTEISKSHAMVVIEDLQLRNMTKCGREQLSNRNGT